MFLAESTSTYEIFDRHILSDPGSTNARTYCIPSQSVNCTRVHVAATNCLILQLTSGSRKFFKVLFLNEYSPHPDVQPSEAYRLGRKKHCSERIQLRIYSGTSPKT